MVVRCTKETTMAVWLVMWIQITLGTWMTTNHWWGMCLQWQVVQWVEKHPYRWGKVHGTDLCGEREIWLKGLLLDFGLKQKSTIHCDNQRTMYLAYNPIYHEQTKQISIMYHFIQAVIAKGKVIATVENSTDINDETYSFAETRALPKLNCHLQRISAHQGHWKS